jgi:lysine 2,3-aminomutase
MRNIARVGRDWRDIPRWQDVTEEQWNDWRWQIKHSLRTLEDVREVLNLSPDEVEGMEATRDLFHTAIPPYYAALMDPDDPDCPVRRQAIPIGAEAHRAPGEMTDPLSEDEHMVAPGLVHRYPDRALLLVNNMCAMYCRFCTRRRYTAQQNEALPREDLQKVLRYLRRHREVRDVLVSGGDPLSMADTRLEETLAALRSVPSIEIIRIGTRMPVVLPMRVTARLAQILRRFAPLFVNTHFNHAKELTAEAVAAVGRLIDAGIPMGNQAVLLRGVNSTPRAVRELVHRLVRARIWPYYLYQCDVVEGSEHFRTPVAKGIEIMESLRGHTSGYAIPRFVIDAPGGGGKVPVMPQYLLSQSEREVKVRNYEWKVFAYPEARDRDCACPYETKFFDPAPKGRRRGTAGRG